MPLWVWSYVWSTFQILFTLYAHIFCCSECTVKFFTHSEMYSVSVQQHAFMLCVIYIERPDFESECMSGYYMQMSWVLYVFVYVTIYMHMQTWFSFYRSKPSKRSQHMGRCKICDQPKFHTIPMIFLTYRWRLIFNFSELIFTIIMRLNRKKYGLNFLYWLLRLAVNLHGHVPVHFNWMSFKRRNECFYVDFHEK